MLGAPPADIGRGPPACVPPPSCVKPAQQLMFPADALSYGTPDGAFVRQTRGVRWESTAGIATLTIRRPADYDGGDVNFTLFHEVLAGRVQTALERARDYDAFEDLPWCLLYRELDEAFPGSKFVLTVRSSSEVWLRSYRRHHAMEHGALLNADGSRATSATGRDRC